MATYELTSPKGEKYQVTAPDNASQEQVMQYFQQNSGHADFKGADQGRTAAVVQGFNSAVPFGERMAAGLGATGAYVYDKATGLDSGSLSDYYKEARQNQEVTAEQHPGYYTGGALTGIAATLPAVSTKAITGTVPESGARGIINAVPKASAAVGDWVRGGEAAKSAGTAASLAGKAIRSAAVAAPAGAIYSYGGSRHDLNSAGALKDAAFGTGVAAILGAAVPVAGAAYNAVTNPSVAPEVQKLATRATKDFGIPLSVDQIAPSRVRNTIQKASQDLPFSGVGDFQANQRQAWNSALARTIGQKADAVTPEVLNKYLEDAGQQFGSILGNQTVTFKQSDIAKIADIAEKAKRKVSTGLADVVQNNVDDFLSNLSQFKVGEQRVIPGEKLASFRSQLLSDLPNIEGGARGQVANIIDAIDNVVGGQLPADKTKALQTARLQWRNFRTIEPLLEKSTTGEINPTQLMQRVASSKYIKASRKVTGQDDLVDLARIGKQFLPVKSGSDTAARVTLGLGTLGNAGLLATAPQIAVPAIAAEGGVMAANRGYQSLINQSPRVVNRLLTNSAPNKIAAKVVPGVLPGSVANQLNK